MVIKLCVLIMSKVSLMVWSEKSHTLKHRISYFIILHTFHFTTIYTTTVLWRWMLTLFKICARTLLLAISISKQRQIHMFFWLYWHWTDKFSLFVFFFLFFHKWTISQSSSPLRVYRVVLYFGRKKLLWR